MKTNQITPKGVDQIIESLRHIHSSQIVHLDVRFNRSVGTGPIAKLMFWTKLNSFGRRFLQTQSEEQQLEKTDIKPREQDSPRTSCGEVKCTFPAGLWPHLLAKASFEVDVMHYFLTEVPGLCNRFDTD